MSVIYQITFTTTLKQIVSDLSRSDFELESSFVALTTETGELHYFRQYNSNNNFPKVLKCHSPTNKKCSVASISSI
ncbi:hypothetical protein SMTE5_14650 [Serratia marcescens]|nr:hypothetical protein SMTE5_14650 [Serratia marcescens]